MPPDTESDQKRSFLLTIAKYSQLGLVLPVATLTGWLLGAGVDRVFHTTWLYMGGLVLGIVAGFVGLLRVAFGMQDNSEVSK